MKITLPLCVFISETKYKIFDWRKKEMFPHITCMKVNMTIWVINTWELAQFLDVPNYISQVLRNLSKIVSVPMYFFLQNVMFTITIPVYNTPGNFSDNSYDIALVIILQQKVHERKLWSRNDCCWGDMLKGVKSRNYNSHAELLILASHSVL